MNKFDFLYDGRGMVVVEDPPKRPRKKSKKKPTPPHDLIPVPWQGTGRRTHNKGAPANDADHHAPRRPEWTTSMQGGRFTFRSAAVVLGVVERLNTEWGVKLFQWRVVVTGQMGEYLDVRAARRAVEKRTLTVPWAHLYDPRGGGIK